MDFVVFFPIYITSALSYRYSVPFFRLPFLRNIHVYLYSKSTIYCLKYTCSCFSSHFRFQKCILLFFFFPIYITSALSYRYSVPFFRLPFLRNIHVDLYSKSTIYCLKYTCSCFSSHFRFSKMYFVVFFSHLHYLCSFLQIFSSFL